MHRAIAVEFDGTLAGRGHGALLRRAVVVSFCVLAFASQGAAQVTRITVEGPGSVTDRLTYEEYRLTELRLLADRSKKATIASAAVVGAGAALVAPALARECVTVTASTEIVDVRCTKTGRTLLGIGYPVLIAGSISLVITGIMLGVRKGKFRNLENQLAYEKARALRWDGSRLGFVF